MSSCAFCGHLCLPAQPFTFDDIEFWVGTGANRAALVIDWVENSNDPPALVWGYRWDGTAQGRDMLNAVVCGRSTLVRQVRRPCRRSDAVVFGLGYDANDDGAFAIDDGTAFDAAGIASFTGPADWRCPSTPATTTPKAGSPASGTIWRAVANPFDGGSGQTATVGMAIRDR